MSSFPQPSQRRHASLACNACRESKIKCNGGNPRCSNCNKKGRKCVYRTIDRRNVATYATLRASLLHYAHLATGLTLPRLPLRMAIDLLSGRVVQLCQYICDSGLRPPPMPSEKDTILKKILENLELHEAVRDLSRTEMLGLAGSQYSASLAEQDVRQNDAQSQRSQQSPHGSAAVVSEIPICQPAEEEQSCGEEDFGSDLQMWNSQDTWASRNLPDSTGLFCSLGDSPLDDDLETTLVNMSNNLASADRGSSDFVQDNTSDWESGNESLVDELSHCVGTLRIGPAGRTKLCGPSSTFKMEGTSPSELFGYHRTHLGIAPYPLGRSGDDPEAPDELEQHLINLYFRLENPSSDIVDRDMYTLAKAKAQRGEDTSYFSEALRNAMCAVGAAFESRYHPAFVTYPKSLVTFFGERARNFLEAELEHPALATIQAMMVLSGHEVGNGNKTRGWLYSGMAVRLAFDLALHLDLSTEVSVGMITAAEAGVRRKVFWSVCNADHALGFQLGRPVRISMEDVTVSKPIASNQGNYDRRQGGLDESASTNGLRGTDVAENVRQQRVALCDIMASCGYILYGTSKYTKDALQKLNASIVAQLCDWKTRLPSHLQINLLKQHSQCAPEILLLHMQYHQNIIYAHRPWMSKHTLQPQPPRGPGYRHARGMCVHSAVAISKILILYESQYKLRQIHHSAVYITSSAALLLLFADVCSCPDWKNEDVIACLSTCFRALDEFALSWQSARQVLDILLAIQQKWRTRKVAVPTNRQSQVPFGILDRLSGSHGTINDISFDYDALLSQNEDEMQGAVFGPELEWSVMNDFQLPLSAGTG